MASSQPTVRKDRFGLRTSRELLGNPERQLRRVRRVALGTFVNFHARVHMEDNDMTQRNLAQLPKSQGF
jgi:hypothetical protein